MIKPVIRSLLRTPAFSLIAVMSLALAIAVNTTLFTVVDAVVHPYLPYGHPSRLFNVGIGGGDRRHPVPSRQLARDIGDALHSAQQVEYYKSTFTLAQSDGFAEDVRAAAVSPGMFRLLELKPEVGRVLDPAAHGDAEIQEAVISHALWNRIFQGGPLAHRKITLGARTFDVIGVLPPGVHFPTFVDVWVPLAAASDTIEWRGGPGVTFRLKPGATQAQAERDLGALVSRLMTEYGQALPYGVRLLRLDGPTRAMGTPGLFEVVVLVLVIACANLGTMMLARGSARRRELAIRMAVGARRRDIVRLVLAECGAIVVVGVAAGALLVFWSMHGLLHLLTPFVPDLGDLRPTLNWRVVLFVACIGVLTIILGGAWPAFRASRTDPAEPLKEGGASSERMRDRYNPLIIVEVALSTTLLMASALLMMFALRMARFRFDYDARDLLSGGVRVPIALVTDSAAADRFFYDALARFARVPHVVSAAISEQDGPAHGVILAEEGRMGTHWINSSGYRTVSPGYLRTLGIPIVSGRDFAPGDAAGSAAVAIVDEMAVHRLWPGLDNPVGRMLKLGDARSPAPWIRVVGVARLTEMGPRKDLDLPPEPTIYVVRPFNPARERELIARGDGAGGYAGRSALAVALRLELRQIAPWDHDRVRPWLQQYERTRDYTAFQGEMLAVFGAFGLVLCAVGLYGVVGYTVARRLREFAIRSALGAEPVDIVRAVLADTTVMLLAGVGIGAFLGLRATYAIAENLFTVHYELVIALIIAEALLLAAGMLACVGPLRRAVNADPVEILRAS